MVFHGHGAYFRRVYYGVCGEWSAGSTEGTPCHIAPAAAGPAGQRPCHVRDTHAPDKPDYAQAVHADALPDDSEYFQRESEEHSDHLEYQHIRMQNRLGRLGQHADDVDPHHHSACERSSSSPS